jgi:hypothetical protein
VKRQIEVALDYVLDSDDEQRLSEYTELGATESEALRRVAQDVFGGLGADVQNAEFA